MLHILWMLLKIIGIILLIILGLLVLSVCVVLFVPLRYQGKAEAVGTLDSLKAHLKFSWMLHLISGYVTYENKETKWQVRILWKKLNVEKKRSQEAASSKDVSETETVEDLETDTEKSESKITESGNCESTEGESTKRSSVETESAQDETQDKSDKLNEKTSSNKTKKQKKNIFEKIKYTFRDFCDKIKALIKKKEKLQEFLTNEIHQSAWSRLKQEIWRLLKFLKPKKLVLNLHFGFEDPSVTGKVLAALSILYPFYLDHINLEPEFDEKILEGDAYIKGTIRGLHLLIIICNLFFDKNIKTTYKAIKNWKR